ncbi:MAG: DUF2147 domain-containing protein [Prolixibacteraceae bacterium]|nr:DUF2147 domain-containing protein [Prolixibacteraceae bacterium]
MKKGINIIVLLLAVLLASANQGIEGKWKTIDDVTGEIKSIVEITIRDGKAYGSVVKLFNEDPAYDPPCKACKGELKNQGILGLQIINGLTFSEEKWVGKKGILDPDNGKKYYCKLWIDEEHPNKLNVRGYIWFFYRSQTWLREPK